MLSNGSVVTVSKALEEGVSKPTFYKFVADRSLKKVGPGIYQRADRWVDDIYIIGLRFKDLIYSHETACYYLDLIEGDIGHNVVTMKTGYNPSKIKELGYKVYTVKESLFELGATYAGTPYGHKVRMYDKERTIIDILRSRNNIEGKIIKEALSTYFSGEDVNIDSLKRYAKAFHVENILNSYLKIFL